jgi:ribosomal protein L12E/L44/L45/RPP1/RPP2
VQGQRSEITRLNGLFDPAAKTLSSAMSPAKTDKTAQPSSSSSSSNREIEDEDEDDDEDDQDGSFLFPIRPQAGGPTEP